MLLGAAISSCKSTSLMLHSLLLELWLGVTSVPASAGSCTPPRPTPLDGAGDTHAGTGLALRLSRDAGLDDDPTLEETVAPGAPPSPSSTLGSIIPEPSASETSRAMPDPPIPKVPSLVLPSGTPSSMVGGVFAGTRLPPEVYPIGGNGGFEPDAGLTLDGMLQGMLPLNEDSPGRLPELDSDGSRSAPRISSGSKQGLDGKPPYESSKGPSSATAAKSCGKETDSPRWSIFPLPS